MLKTGATNNPWEERNRLNNTCGEKEWSTEVLMQGFKLKCQPIFSLHGCRLTRSVPERNCLLLITTIQWILQNIYFILIENLVK